MGRTVSEAAAVAEVVERWFGERDARVVVDEAGEVVLVEVGLLAGGDWLGRVVSELGGLGVWVERIDVVDERRTPQLRRSENWLCRWETVIRVRGLMGDGDWEPVRRWALGLADWPWSGG
jgi:hypothetical protein